MKSIVHIITDLNIGGAERALYTLVTSGLEEKFTSSVISLRSDGHYGPLLREFGIPVTSLNINSFSSLMLALPRLKDEIVNRKPDIIQGWMYHANLFALLGSLFMPKYSKVIWNIRLSLEDIKRRKITTRFVVKLGAIFSKQVCAIIYNSNRSLAQHKSYGYICTNQLMIPNGFDVARWIPDNESTKAIRLKYGINADQKIIGFVGRGDDQKDIPNLCSAFSLVQQAVPGVTMLCIGPNVYDYRPRNIPLYGVIFTGAQKDIEKLMPGFDILCLSSRSEGFPNVLGEAMSCAVPCVTTNVGDASEIVGDTGWVVDPADNFALAAALIAALQMDLTEMKVMGNKARERVIQEYGIHNIVSRYVEFYSKIYGVY
ncbi:glycosyltransferase [Polynucleobacter sp. JS-Mosq-20-D10]|uniref:glycosyltransferase n=1 Tax=Polynucleobacter sp. JS-Mosq-20-D10 TaxID=2576922 RepID=UPI001BFED043|nr:glycosyltransferase [Polynucleobacter sp. JS-Mosq-20-D10]QWE00794.1 glycosyltransferase [Polynucleobacter sp. JS-Mosq-20-D10]